MKKLGVERNSVTVCGVMYLEKRFVWVFWVFIA